MGSFFLKDGFVVPVSGDYGVVDGAGDVVEDVQRFLRGDVEEFAVLPNAKVGESVYGFVDEFFDFGVLFRLYCGEDFKG